MTASRKLPISASRKFQENENIVTWTEMHVMMHMFRRSETQLLNCHSHFVFLNSPHKSSVCVGKFCRYFNDIYWNKPPKHATLSLRTLAPTWALPPRPSQGGAQIFESSEQRSDPVKSRDSTDTVSHHLRRTHRKTMVRHLPEISMHFHASDMSSVQRPNLCLATCTKPHLQISTDTFVACTIHQRAK